MKRALRLPTVHLGESSAAAQLRDAAQSPGFFYVSGTTSDGVTDAKRAKLIGTALQDARAFFRVDTEIKRRCANRPEVQYRVDGHAFPGTGNGYRGKGLDPFFPLDDRESFNFGREQLPEEEEAPYGNAWPDDHALPAGWRQRMEIYSRHMEMTAKDLRRVVALALGLEEAFFDQPGYFDLATWQQGMVRYGSRLSRPEEGELGIAPHADTGIFTLLATDSQPGLQICPDKSQAQNPQGWFAVPPPTPGALLVNLGTDLEVFSNGLFQATLHRVVNKGDVAERFSLPFFYETNLHCVVAPLPHLYRRDSQPRFTAMSPAQKLRRGNLDATDPNRHADPVIGEVPYGALAPTKLRS